jgi:uncharacterized protein
VTAFRDLSFRLWAALALLISGGGLARAAEVIPPAPTAYFNDYAGVVRPEAVASMNAELDQFERDTSNQILVAIYPHMESDSSIEDYTVRVAQSWRVGQKGKKNGAVLFVFEQDHTLYIQAGYGLEAVLPDALCQRIIDDVIVPRIHDGDFTGAMQAGVDAILAAARGEYKGNGATAADDQAGGQGGLPLPAIVLIFLFLVVLSVVRSFQHVVYNGVGRRGYWSRGVPWILTGGGGGGGGFGGGGGGGFSGGGGSFGGGGAGGRW